MNKQTMYTTAFVALCVVALILGLSTIPKRGIPLGYTKEIQDEKQYREVLEKCMSLPTTDGRNQHYNCRRNAEDAAKIVVSWDGSKWVKAVN